MSLSGHSVYYLGVLTVWFCLLAVSQAYVNVALNKPAYHKHAVPDSDIVDANNAVDGRKSDTNYDGGQCAGSYVSQIATWWVNLTRLHSIHHITLYFSTDANPWGPTSQRTRSALGFSMYVSNTTNRLQGTLCYKDDNFTTTTIPTVFTITCPVHGQYVIYYNERLKGVTYPSGYMNYAVSGLCEVEVYVEGCPATGYFGSNCSVPCLDVNCQYCHIETGTCLGCKDGYKGHRCELTCDRVTYGAVCKETCGHCRDVNQCSNTNGTCLTGCDAGFKGNLCKTVCDRGSYGHDCKETCGHCRDVDQCSNVNGICLTGCDAGYEGGLCKQFCDRGSYGSECSETCGHCRDENQCSNINGTCLTGCDAGYQGDLCKYPCPVGYFGQECSETCINSYTCDGCNDVSGSCDNVCRPGWILTFCQKTK
ncbi:multiple epidermal growth factor-like domains protein 10 [Crassostrea angulata]|uniref:multiple epidermal growth factor-like domains protein 10 n=1 Tax=Magallana angulata TaxID=2784310 RepID=UPI0022B09696|nr:multiple epidermal growth factor-like domains protein 10 [Crassostrea angulata]